MIADFDHLSGLYGLKDCEKCDGSKCKAKKLRAPVLGSSAWPSCPVDCLNAPEWRIVVETFNAKNAGIPIPALEDLAAWFVDAFGALERATGKAALARIQREAQKG